MHSIIENPLYIPAMHWHSTWLIRAWCINCEIHLMDKICVLSRSFFSACVDRLLFVTSWIIDVFVVQPLRVPRRRQWHSDVQGKAQGLLCELCIFNTHYDRGTKRRNAKNRTQPINRVPKTNYLSSCKDLGFAKSTAYPLQNVGLIRLAVSPLMRPSVDSGFVLRWKFESSSRYSPRVLPAAAVTFWAVTTWL